LPQDSENKKGNTVGSADLTNPVFKIKINLWLFDIILLFLAD